MLVIGLVSTREEQNEIKYIAEMAILSNRIRYIARQHRDNENNSSE